MKKNLQSLTKNLNKNKLLNLSFKPIISILLISSLAACTSKQAPVAKYSTVQFEPCSYVEMVQNQVQFQSAFQTCLRNAEYGDPVSQKNLANIYYYGNRYIHKDINESVKWLKKAAENGNKVAEYRLAKIIGNTQLSALR